MNRRSFLKNSALAAAAVGTTPLWNRIAFAKGARAAAGTDTVLVTVNLYGGNDGLNTLVPLTQYDRYRALRPRLGLDRDRLLALPGASDFAFNPTMTAMRDMYARGDLAIIAGAGMPHGAEGLFDHERAQRSYQTGLATNYTESTSGWIGKWLDSVTPGPMLPGVDMGGGFLLVNGARRQPLSVGSIDEFVLSPSFDDTALESAYAQVIAARDSDGGAGEAGRMQREVALRMSAVVREGTAGYESAGAYPEDSYLGFTLGQTAALVNADIGVRAVSVGIGGFDTHSNQDDGGSATSPGYHSQLVGELSASIGAFYDDLAAHGNASRVLLLVFSEFGRRPEENNDRGTDHGYGSVMFAAGPMVRGGMYGEHPSLAEERLVFDGNVDVTTDFRSVYATVASGFLGVDPVPLLGGNFRPLGFL